MSKLLAAIAQVVCLAVVGAGLLMTFSVGVALLVAGVLGFVLLEVFGP